MVVRTSFQLFLVVFVTVYSIKNDNHIYKKIVTDSLYTCVAECSISTVCQSLTYDISLRTCYLNDNKTDDARTTSGYNESRYNTSGYNESGYITEEMTESRDALTGPCAKKTCPPKFRCFVDRLHRAVCVSEFAGCGEPPDVAGALKEFHGRYSIAKTTYTCKEDHLRCHSNTTSVCQATGQWEDVSGLCGRYRWSNRLNVRTPFPHPCGLERRFEIRIVGTPTANKKFSISFGRSVEYLEYLFWLEFRFLDSSDKLYPRNCAQIIMNSYFSKIWTKPIFFLKHYPFPVAVGREFQMVISLRDGVYFTQVDGVVLPSFKERKYHGEVHEIAFHEFVSVSLIEFKI